MAKKQSGPGPVTPMTVRPAAVGAATTGETVTVACKMPNGILMRGFAKDERDEVILGGGVRKVPYWHEDGRVVRIYGNARPKGGSLRTRVVCGFALTQGVPKDLWDQWVEANAEQPMVRNGLIMAWPTTEMAVDGARDNRKQRSGLEPLEAKIEDDPRVPRSLDSQVSDLQMDQEKMKPGQFEDADEEAA